MRRTSEMGQTLARPREVGCGWWQSDELLLDYLLLHCEERLKPGLKQHFSNIKLAVALQRNDWYARFYAVFGEDAASLTDLLARRRPPRRRRRRLLKLTTPRTCLGMIPEDSPAQADYVVQCHCGAPLVASHLCECPIYKDVFFDALRPSIPEPETLESHVLLTRLAASRDLTHLVSRFLHLIFKRRRRTT